MNTLGSNDSELDSYDKEISQYLKHDDIKNHNLEEDNQDDTKKQDFHKIMIYENLSF